MVEGSGREHPILFIFSSLDSNHIVHNSTPLLQLASGTMKHPDATKVLEHILYVNFYKGTVYVCVVLKWCLTTPISEGVNATGKHCH